MFPFGGMAAGGGSQPAVSESGNRILLQFRAGRMNRNEQNIVHADARKGLITIERGPDDLMHFCWKERGGSNNNRVEEDSIIFPDEAEFKHIPQCTTGRAYVLRFTSSNRRLFFWMQEPNADKDAELVTKLNGLLNNPPQPGASESGGIDLDSLGLGGMPGLGGLTQEQLMEMFGGIIAQTPQVTSRDAQTPQAPAPAPAPLSQGTPSTPGSASNLTGTEPSPLVSTPGSTSTPTPAPASSTSSTASSTTTTPGFQLSQLQNILANTTIPPEQADLDLTKILTPAAVSPLLHDRELQQQLFPFLPDKAEHTVEELESIIRSPQFIQALKSLNAALQSGQLAPLLSQLGLDPAIGGPMGGVEAFLQAIQQKADMEKEDKMQE